MAALLALGATGCLFAAAAGAGGAIYLTDRGAESLVTASVDRTYDAARDAFRDMDIRETKNTTEEDKRQLEGSQGDREITVKIEKQDQNSKVEVVARKTAVTWDKDYAKAVLEKIIEKAK